MQVRADKKPLTGWTVFLSILAFFGVVMAVNVTMMTLAVETLPGTDVDNPYGAGLAYNKEISAARAQEARGWHVVAHVERQADGQSTIRVEARDNAGVPVTGLAFFARLAHPIDRRADHAASLFENEPGIYRGTAENVAVGQWELIIEGERGSERMFMSRNRLVLR
jgi:nitrogen fixation protein FixH